MLNKNFFKSDSKTSRHHSYLNLKVIKIQFSMNNIFIMKTYILIIVLISLIISVDSNHDFKLEPAEQNHIVFDKKFRMTGNVAYADFKIGLDLTYIDTPDRRTQ